MVAAYSDASGQTLEVSGNGSSGDLKHNDHNSNAAGINRNSKFEIDPLGSAATKINANNLMENVVKLGASHEQDHKGVRHKENQVYGEEKIQIMKKMGDSDEKDEQFLMKETSLKYGNNTADSSSKSDAKHNAQTRKVVVPAEKLWDGFLKLNPSVTISAVAIFKSGEKMPDIKWSDSVEVKGKVKLEDFQNYIQDLPRSRNRRLMVVSLRWKEGSSKTGLAGIKKVAKGYKEGHRVGFAQLSPGIDLYVCPHSETIITILAKHGFFKGKTAIEDNKDSLIGCVVWRRNQTKLKSREKKSERCKDEVSNWSPIGLPPESILEPSRTGRNDAGVDAAPNPGLQNLSTSYDSFATQCTHSISPSVPVGPETSYSDPANQQVSVRQLSKLDPPLMGKSGEERQELNLKLERAVLVLSSEVRKQSSPILGGEDDLPEFDFGTSCGVVSQDVTNKALDSVTIDRKLLDKGYGNMDSSLPPIVPNLKSWPTSFQRRLANFGCPGLVAADDTPYMPPQKKARNHNSISMLPFVVDRQNRYTKMSYAASVVLPTRNLFDDDDDDMPEWCPPNVSLEKHINQSLDIRIHSQKPNTIRPLITAAAQNSLSFPSSIAAERPPVSIQPAHFTYHCQRAQPITANSCLSKGPDFNRESNWNPSFRPDSCQNNGKLQVNRGAGKGWMS